MVPEERKQRKRCGMKKEGILERFLICTAYGVMFKQLVVGRSLCGSKTKKVRKSKSQTSVATWRSGNPKYTAIKEKI